MPLPPLTPYARLRWDVVARLVAATLPQPGARVLEIGCGQGAVGVRLAGRHRYTGVELDGASVAVARQRATAAGVDARLVHGPLATIDDDGFDLVCAFEVIEHIDDDAAALAEWAARLRPGGTLLLSTLAWPSRYGAMDEAVGHFRRYEPDALAGLLAGAGLDDVGTRLYGAPLGYALEAVRNRIAARDPHVREDAVADRTARSGRLFQPSTAVQGAVIAAGTWPFRLLQRAFPRTGPGLIAWGRAPAA
ncbi:Methyltransferase type 11 [Xylanimonas cellulosilytica DSM 15894]|uniref:Methyltransferase type 11 n=1 Tax=Xylanimonas cellulosilytica (strain DSM 15894 / JCM 12276 / CECT 5975 / KCTC 9989 / LMG 20990 / NBRC 107835 / XIL07) TaxID=446471 RepID=D1BWZ8_XYLCX|nr:class I SAM-dependent methyltransferase [Xylanimonas cellulosilytica]ACZ31566.1 Methyltransferase type 11 [Xylanimonas cellulosilytica DSM 15894]